MIRMRSCTSPGAERAGPGPGRRARRPDRSFLAIDLYALPEQDPVARGACVLETPGVPAALGNGRPEVQRRGTLVPRQFHDEVRTPWRCHDVRGCAARWSRCTH